MLHVRPYSSAARDVDELANRYAEALVAVANALEVDADALPTIAVYLSDLPSDEPALSHGIQHGALSVEPSAPREVTIWTTYGNESPSIAAEVELARAILAYDDGAGQASARFWDEGLAGRVAARSGRSSYHADADTHCRQLLHDGVLSPLSELIDGSAGHLSALSSSAATAPSRPPAPSLGARPR